MYNFVTTIDVHIRTRGYAYVLGYHNSITSLKYLLGVIQWL